MLVIPALRYHIQLENLSFYRRANYGFGCGQGQYHCSQLKDADVGFQERGGFTEWLHCPLPLLLPFFRMEHYVCRSAVYPGSVAHS
jgi:hypothetical protein